MLVWIAVLLAWVAIVGCLWAIFQLIAQNGRLLLRVEALERHLGELAGLSQPAYATARLAMPDPLSPADHEQEPEARVPPRIQAGTVLHDFELPDLAGVQHLRSAWLGQRLLMAFVSPYCRHSRRLIETLAQAQPDAADRPALLLVSTGSIDENRRLVERTGLIATVLVQEEMEVGALFDVPATPMAYLVDEDGRTAGPLLAGHDAIVQARTHPEAPGTDAAFVPSPAVSLADVTTPAPANGAHYAGGLEVGSVAPPFDLPCVDGGRVALDRLRGSTVFLAFTDPEHAPCDEVAPALKRLHESESGVAVIVVARGEADGNRRWAATHELATPLGVQHRWDLSREYGLLAVPIAFVVDAQGIIATPVAIGADAVIELSESLQGALA